MCTRHCTKRFSVSVHLIFTTALRGAGTIMVPIFTAKATEIDYLAQSYRAKTCWLLTSSPRLSGCQVCGLFYKMYHCYILLNIHPTLALRLSPPLSNNALYWMFTLFQSLVHVLSSIILTTKGEELLYPFYTQWSGGRESLRNLPEITQLVSGRARIQGISYKWNHSICGILCLASFCLHNVFAVRVKVFISILLLSLLRVFRYTEIPLCLSVHQLMDIWMVSISGLLWMMKQCTSLICDLSLLIFSVSCQSKGTSSEARTWLWTLIPTCTSCVNGKIK